MWVVLLKWKLEWDRNKNHVAVKLGVFIFIFFIIMIWGVSFSNSRGSSEMLSFLVLLDDGCSLLPFGAYSLHQNHHHHLHHHYLLFLLASYTYMATSFDYQGEEMCDGQLKINYLLACLLSCLSVAWVTLETSEFVTYIVDIIFKLHAHL